MGFSVTALQLVNRVHRRRRMPDVGAFSETEDIATLNAINHAIDRMMSEQRWDFNIRTDGQIKLNALVNDCLLTSVADNSTVIVNRNAGIDTDQSYGDFVLRIVPSGVSEYSDTSFRVVSSSDAIGGQTIFSNLEVGFPVSSTEVSCELHYSEYTLPDTVEAVIRATHEEEELQLEQIDPRIGYSELFPRKHIETGYPRMVSTGGFSTPTYLSSLSANSVGPSIRMDVWPIPDEDYIINFSYYYRHPELISVDDKLVGVPPVNVDQIVELAASDMKVYYDRDYNALRSRLATEASIRDVHNTHGGNRVARKPFRGWESGRGWNSYRSPFSGKLLG